ncbi:MAG: hypothetical protein M3307_05420 [Thermoproteota archaeon]|nr:hypothetical protein [Thermoproteota archaeon]
MDRWKLNPRPRLAYWAAVPIKGGSSYGRSTDHVWMQQTEVGVLASSLKECSNVPAGAIILQPNPATWLSIYS